MYVDFPYKIRPQMCWTSVSASYICHDLKNYIQIVLVSKLKLTLPNSANLLCLASLQSGVRPLEVCSIESRNDPSPKSEVEHVFQS